MGRGVGAHGRARHLAEREPPARRAPSHPCQHGPSQRDLGRGRHVKAELDLLLLVGSDGGRRRVGRVQQHLVVVVRCVRRPEGGVVEDAKLLPHVLHIDFHLLHGAVEDAFGLLDREWNLFRHEVAIVQRNPCPEGCLEKKNYRNIPRGPS